MAQMILLECYMASEVCINRNLCSTGQVQQPAVKAHLDQHN